MRLTKKGFSTAEAIAAVVIISLVMVSAVTIVINMRNQAKSTEKRFEAVDVATRIRSSLSSNADYALVDLWLAQSPNQVLVVDLNTCDAGVLPCDLVFGMTSNGTLYDTEVSLVFPQTEDSDEYRIIHYSIIIVYYGTRSIQIEGMIYDTYE